MRADRQPDGRAHPCDATAMVEGPRAGLELVATLDKDERLANHYRLDAVRAHLHEMAGNREPRSGITSLRRSTQQAFRSRTISSAQAARCAIAQGTRLISGLSPRKASGGRSFALPIERWRCCPIASTAVFGGTHAASSSPPSRSSPSPLPPRPGRGSQPTQSARLAQRGCAMCGVIAIDTAMFARITGLER